MKEIKDGIKVEGLHLRAPFNLERVSFTLPPPDDDSILIKVRLCGICSTDVAMFVGELPPLPKEMFGHEAVGEVVWKGKNIKDVEVGDYVSCYWHPGYATYLIAPKGTYIKVPELSIKWNLQPIACVLNCLFLLPFGKICGDGVLVIGSGFNALVLAQLMPEATFVGQHHQDLFETFGIKLHSWAQVEGKKFPVVIETTGRNSFERLLNLIETSGTLIWLAPPHTPQTADVFKASWNAITIHFPSPRSHFFSEALKLARSLISQGKLNPGILYTHHYPIDAFEDAFKDASIRRPSNHCKSYFVFP